MVELRRRPRRCVVAHLASGSEPLLCVIGIIGVVVVGLMTGDASRISGGQVVVVVLVAIRARSRGHRVGAGQRERSCRVIKLCRYPGDGGVAVLTSRGRKRLRILGVPRIGGVVVVRLVARYAGRVSGGQVVIIVLVAILASARRHRVAARQHEAGDGVVELRVRPTVGRMATLAGSSGEEGGASVLGIGRAVEILLVTADAVGRHRRELAESTVLMTVLAGGRGMGAGQGEAVHMHLDLRDRHFPAADGMAVLAGSSHLAAVDVGMAVGAFVADVAEHHLRMTVHAVDALVHAAQGEFGLVVIEFGYRPNRPPAIDGVAILASNIQIAVRTAAAIGRVCVSSAGDTPQHQHSA